LAKNSDTTPGDAALEKVPSTVEPATALLRLAMSWVIASRSLTETGPLQAGAARLRRPGLAETISALRG
jgi:hypothetical protein